MNSLKATHSMLLPHGPADAATPPRWIHIMPAGTFSGRDGRGPYHLKDSAAVIAASMSRAVSAGLPMDYDHQMENTSKNGAPALASGWIGQLEARDDGIWAEVEWTEKARAHVTGREYRYVSPVFYHQNNGEITAIESVALTNLPNFGSLKALASKETTTATQGSTMNKALASMLGLHEEASENAVHDAVRQLQEENKALAAKAETPDPAKFVPMPMFEGVQKELASMKAAHATAQAEALVEAAAAEGKISPAMHEWAKAYASKDAEDFKAWAALAPDLRPGGEQKATAAKGTPPGDGDTLTEDEKAIARACGLSEEDYKKGKKA